MPTATIIRAWKDANSAYLAVRVTEVNGNVEYIGSIPLAGLTGTAAQQRAQVVAAVKAERDARIAAITEITGFDATVSI